MNAADLARAKQIAADLKRMSPDSNMVEIVCRLLDEYELQAKQIAILKATLVDAYAQLGCGCSMDHQLTSAQLRLDFVLWRNAVTPEIRAFWSEWAKKQLARELPEIFKEDKQ